MRKESEDSFLSDKNTHTHTEHRVDKHDFNILLRHRLRLDL